MSDAPAPAAQSATPAPDAQPSAPASGAGGQPSSPATAARPEYVPEKFWDGEKNTVRTEDVFKSYTELEKKIGQPRFDFPAEDAPPEAKSAFQAKLNAYLGVPDKPEGYGFEAPKSYPEHMGEYMKETLSDFAKVCSANAVPPAAAKAIQGWFDDMAVKLGEAGANASKAEMDAANTRMDEHFTKIFGDQKTVAVESVKQAMTKAIPDAALRADLEKALPNEALVVIAALDQHYKKTYGQSDNNTGDGGGSGGKTPADLRKDAQTLMASPEYRDPMNKGHKEAKERAQQMYADIAALTDGAKKK